MAGSSRMLLELARDRSLCRAVASYGFYRLAEYGPWLAILVYAYGHGGATATGLVSCCLFTALRLRF